MQLLADIVGMTDVRINIETVILPSEGIVEDVIHDILMRHGIPDDDIVKACLPQPKIETRPPMLLHTMDIPVGTLALEPTHSLRNACLALVEKEEMEMVGHNYMNHILQARKCEEHLLIGILHHPPRLIEDEFTIMNIAKTAHASLRDDSDEIATL